MNKIQILINDYLEYCRFQKCLDEKTIKAYRIDLRQFDSGCHTDDPAAVTADALENYIAKLHQIYKPKTAKRKIASLKAFFHYLEYRELIAQNPFHKIQIKFREPVILPKTIPLRTVESLLSAVYRQHANADTVRRQKITLRDAAVIETLFATGMRISELCTLKPDNVNLCDGKFLIYGKGSKERIIQIGNTDVIRILQEYESCFAEEIRLCNHFFANQNGSALSDQAVRRMLNKYTSLSSIDLRITPHMFRHTFATCLLEADVDIRYIQQMLGHSSINITEIYTHVAMAKQRDILTNKHPRNGLRVG